MSELTKGKALDTIAKQYILDCIDAEEYEENPKTDKESLQFLYDTFMAEVGKWRAPQIGKQNAFREWTQGLPTCFNIDFANYDIIQLAKKWGSLAEDATEAQEYKILNNYWNFITVKTFQLFRAHKISDQLF